ncbi:hypothetical protein IHE55_11815 [Streptomyces pactum]|uniref:Uncharacterized protein n=1 Tax=Streptomyces pactum TaxID=68249 RepID=A0ABS0NJV7_9ACTN|nr:hypothetical protein [Streptomyces pactum]MBH5335446.1 hypothetical protein [Streptomyces pactum]
MPTASRVPGRPVARRTSAVAGCAAVLAVTLAGCGEAGNVPPGERLNGAVERLGERESLSVSFRLDAPPERMAELLDIAPTGPGSGGEAPAVDGLRVRFEVRAKKPIAEAGEKDLVGARLTFGTRDADLAEYRMVGTSVYYRADFGAFAELAGGPEGGPFGEELDKRFGDKWFRVDTDELTEDGPFDGFGPGAKRKGKADGTAPGLSPAQGQKVLDALRTAVADGVTVEDRGTRDGVTHVVATGSARQLLTGVVDALRPVAGELPGGEDLPTAKDLRDVPDEEVSLDFSVRDGALTGIGADLAPLVDGGREGEKFPVGVEFGAAGEITAPPAADTVRPEEMFQEFLGEEGFDDLADDEDADADFSVEPL